MRKTYACGFFGLAAVAGLIGGTSVQAAVFNVANTADAGTYGTITGQGFSAIATGDSPGVSNGAAVYLSQFQFYKGTAGTANASDIFAVVFNGAYPDLSTTTSAATAAVGTSTNVINSTTSFTSGEAISFQFADLPLVYGNTYSIGLFTGTPSAATAAQASVLTANYSETSPGSGVYAPTTNYGGADNYQASAYFNVSGGYYSAYSGAGDTNFFATLATEVPEPTTASIAVAVTALLGRRRRQIS